MFDRFGCVQGSPHIEGVRNRYRLVNFTQGRIRGGNQATWEDTTGLNVRDGDIVEGKKRTDSFTIAGGTIDDPQIGKARNMASESNLAKFVAQTLDNAEASGAKQTWIDLVDHGGGEKATVKAIYGLI